MRATSLAHSGAGRIKKGRRSEYRVLLGTDPCGITRNAMCWIPTVDFSGANTVGHVLAKSGAMCIMSSYTAT